MNSTFETIFKEHYGKLYTLAFRMTGNKEDSEDILQTSFLNAYSSFDRFRHDSSVYTWLYRIVLNASKKFNLKSKKLQVVKYSEDHNIPQSDVYDYINQFGQTEDNAVIEQMRESCLQMFMNCLPPRYRAVYTLRIILRFSVKETSDILDVSENTVKVNLHRARQISTSHFEGRCSLIHPGSPCDCRSFAKYMIETNRVDELPDIIAIRNIEKISVTEFKNEITEILEIAELYNTTIKPKNYSDFSSKVKQLIKDKKLKILEYR